MISELVKETGLVIFAAPKADTRVYISLSFYTAYLTNSLSYSILSAGCNKQACHFRDTTQDFTGLGYTVFGLTADPPAALSKWQSKNTLGYSLLSDPNREFIKLLGADNGGSTKRSHFVFEKGTGKLLEAKIGVKPDTRYV